MNNDFDWLHQTVTVASRTESLQAYTTAYDIVHGMQMKHQSLSTSEFAIPDSVDRAVKNEFHPHHIAMGHPLCNIAQDSYWLMKPVGKLVSRMHASKLR